MPSPFDALRARLAARVAVTAAFVTACGGETDAGHETTPPSGGAGGAVADAGHGGSGGGVVLPPLPSADSGLLSCPGEEPLSPDAGYSYALAGPCCPEVACFTPEAAGACPPGQPYDFELTSALFPGRSFGSGECMCGIQGPYRGDADNACCYVASIQWCTGRTLWVGGAPLVAPLVGERWT